LTGSAASERRAANHRGKLGEQAVNDVLARLGYDAEAIASKRYRYFIDAHTKQKRLGIAVKDDGDYFDGLFDIIAWGEHDSLRIQIKTYGKPAPPDKEWRERVQALKHPPNCYSEWWSVVYDESMPIEISFSRLSWDVYRWSNAGKWERHVVRYQ
jgi:hypothetical protein